MRRTHAIVLFLVVVGAVRADTAAAPRVHEYSSSGGEVILIVDPNDAWRDEARKPILTLRKASGEVLWKRGPAEFEDFRYPVHAYVSSDGAHLVFGGVGAHNELGDRDRDGIRIYRGDGTLVRFVSRRLLQPGWRSISTEHWMDSQASSLDSSRGTFAFVPGGGRIAVLMRLAVMRREEADRGWQVPWLMYRLVVGGVTTEFDLRTGRLVSGIVDGEWPRGLAAWAGILGPLLLMGLGAVRLVRRRRSKG